MAPVSLGEGLFQEGGEADVGGGANFVDGVNEVDVDDAAGVPEFGEGFELGVEGCMAGTGPEFAVADEVARDSKIRIYRI